MLPQLAMSRYVVHAGPACGIQCEHGDGVPPRCPAELTWQLQTMGTCRAHVARDGDPRLPSWRQDVRSHGLEPRPLWMLAVCSGQVSFETSCSRPHVGAPYPTLSFGPCKPATMSFGCLARLCGPVPSGIDLRN